MSKKIAGIAGAVALLAMTVACGSASPGDKTVITPPLDSPSAAATKAAAPLSKADVKLGVKTTKKDCFGSAGCNVDYKITMGLTGKPQECDITYEVRGLEDPQTGTLTVHADGTFEQDDWQSGQTTSSSRKLTAVVTDIDCGVIR